MERRHAAVAEWVTVAGGVAHVIRCLSLHDAVAIEDKAVGARRAALALRVHIHQLLQRRLALDLEEFGDVAVLDGGLLIQVVRAQRTGADQDLQTMDVRRGGVG